MPLSYHQMPQNTSDTQKFYEFTSFSLREAVNLGEYSAKNSARMSCNLRADLLYYKVVQAIQRLSSDREKTAMKRIMIWILCVLLCAGLCGTGAYALAEGEEPTEPTTTATTTTTTTTSKRGELIIIMSVEDHQVTLTVGVILEGLPGPIPHEELRLNLTVDGVESTLKVPSTGKMVIPVSSPHTVRASVSGTYINNVFYAGTSENWTRPAGTTTTTTTILVLPPDYFTTTTTTTKPKVTTTQNTAGGNNSNNNNSNATTLTPIETIATTEEPTDHIPTTTKQGQPSAKGGTINRNNWLGIGMIALAILLILGAASLIFFFVIRVPKDKNLESDEIVEDEEPLDEEPLSESPDEEPSSVSPSKESSSASQVDELIADIEAERTAKEESVSLDDLVD